MPKKNTHYVIGVQRHRSQNMRLTKYATLNKYSYYFLKTYLFVLLLLLLVHVRK